MQQLTLNVQILLRMAGLIGNYLPPLVERYAQPGVGRHTVLLILSHLVIFGQVHPLLLVGIISGESHTIIVCMDKDFTSFLILVTMLDGVVYEMDKKSQNKDRQTLFWMCVFSKTL